VHLTTEPIDLTSLLLEARPGDGGVCLFVGVVRDQNEGRQTTEIQYDAYASMAEAEIDGLLRSLGERWPEARVSIRHRLGRLQIGEASVAVVATAPHRREAFAACREAIDRLKTTVPIWKKEFYRDGSSEWIDPSRASRQAGSDT
jgi:molybdopterin synthase catalytic subunit